MYVRPAGGEVRVKLREGGEGGGDRKRVGGEGGRRGAWMGEEQGEEMRERAWMGHVCCDIHVHVLVCTVYCVGVARVTLLLLPLPPPPLRMGALVVMSSYVSPRRRGRSFSPLTPW